MNAAEWNRLGVKKVEAETPKQQPYFRNRCPVCWKRHKSAEALTEHMKARHPAERWREI